MTHQLVPKIKPSNRQQKRLMTDEYLRCFPLLWEIENRFYTDLFCDNGMTYQETYTYWLDRYQEVVKYIKTKVKPSLWILDERHFADSFSPRTLNEHGK
jgi:hypothetical protein